MGPMGGTRRGRHTKPCKLSEAAPNSGAQRRRATAFEAAMVLTTKNTQGGKDYGQTSTAKKQDIIPTRQLKLRLFVGGLGPTVGPKDLQDRLAPLGQVSGIQMINSKEDGGDGTHRGFAFLDFEAFSDASLQKLFSAYNGCKWKGGVLRVEKAKEHYTNRLSREWAEAEVAKAKVMESQLQPDLINAGNLCDKTSRGSAAREIPFLLTEPLKIPVPFSKKVRLVPPKGTGRHKRSFQYFPSLPIGELTQESSPQFAAKRQKLVQPENFQHESGYAMNECAVNDAEQDEEVDEIAVDVARERTRQLKLLQRLFPDDNEDTRAEQEKSVDFLQIPNVSQQSNDNARQEKIIFEKPSEHHVKLQDLPLRNMNKQSQEEQDFKQIAKQKMKERRVSILEESDAAPNHTAKDSKLMTQENHRGESTERVDVAKFVQPILKKTQNESQAVKNHKNLPQDDEDEDEDEDNDSLEDEYFSSSRSPTPEGNLSEKSKWDRLFKHANAKKGQDVPMSCDGMFTGISLDDDEDEEPAGPVSSDSKREILLQGDTGTGIRSDSTILDRAGDPNLDLSCKSNNKSRPEKSSKAVAPVQVSTTENEILTVVDASPKSASKCEIVAEGDVAIVRFGSEEKSEGMIELDDVSMKDPSKSSSLGYEGDAAIVRFGSEKESEDMIELDDVSMEDPSKSSSSGYEDANGEIGLDEEDSEFSSDEYVDAELKSASPQALSKAAKVSKWENMFNSAMSVGDESSRGGTFSGSLDDAHVNDTTKDVFARPRSLTKKTRMFQGAAAALDVEGDADDAPSVSKNSEPFLKENTCEVVISNAGQITEEKAIIPIASKKEDAGGDSGDDSEYASDLQKKGDNVGGNLLARFEMEGITSDLSKSPTPQAGSPQQGQSENEGEIDLDHQISTSAIVEGSNSTLLAKENSKWVQRATWRSLVGADGQAAFSLKQVTGECDSEIITRKEVEEPEQATTEQPFTFNFNLAHTRPDSPKAVWPPHNPVIAKAAFGSTSSGRMTEEKKEDSKAGVLGVDGCVFMKSTTAEKDWRASKSELRMDSKAKHKSAVRTMKKLRSSGGAR